MSQKLNSEVAVIGIDIGKNSFRIVGQDRRGALVLRQKWSRGQVEARLANLPPCLIGMEACTGAHHLSRKLQALGGDLIDVVRATRCGIDPAGHAVLQEQRRPFLAAAGTGARRTMADAPRRDLVG
jgi:hypothetical protein